MKEDGPDGRALEVNTQGGARLHKRRAHRQKRTHFFGLMIIQARLYRFLYSISQPGDQVIRY